MSKSQAHKPTEENRKMVKALSSYGIKHEDIATEIGIHDDTLRKYYAAELARGAARSKSSIAKTAYQIAVEDRNPTMVIFLCKTRLGWKEVTEIEHSGSFNVTVNVNKKEKPSA